MIRSFSTRSRKKNNKELIGQLYKAVWIIIMQWLSCSEDLVYREEGLLLLTNSMFVTTKILIPFKALYKNRYDQCYYV